MIPPMRNTRVTGYLWIDRCCEGYQKVEPAEGEMFIGIPYGWYEESSKPFIEVRKDGKLVRTVNCEELSEVFFEETKPEVGK